MITARESSTSSSTCSRDRWHLLPDSRREASESESSTSTARSSRATLNRPVRRLKGLHLKSNSFYEENALPSVTPGPTPGNTRSQQFRPSDVSVTASTLPYAQDEAYSNQRLRSPRFEPVAPTWLTHHRATTSSALLGQPSVPLARRTCCSGAIRMSASRGKRTRIL